MLLNRKKIGKANERLENKRARMSRIGCYGRDRLREKMKRKIKKRRDRCVVSRMPVLQCRGAEMISLTGLSADLRVKVVPNGNGTFARPHTRQTGGQTSGSLYYLEMRRKSWSKHWSRMRCVQMPRGEPVELRRAGS